jgi:hypothetical protein
MEPFEWAVPSQNFIRNRNLDDFSNSDGIPGRWRVSV